MAGLLGQGWDDPQSAAIMALAGGLLQGNPGGGLLGANQAFLQAKQAAAQGLLAQAQLDEAQASRKDRELARAQKERLMQETERLFAPPPAGVGQLGSGSFGVLPPSPGQPSIPQGGLSGASLEQIARLKAIGGPDLLEAWKTGRQGFKREPGSFYESMNGQREYIPRLPEGSQPGPGGSVQPIPGMAETLSTLKGAEARATEAARANFDLVQAYNPATGRNDWRPRSQVLSAAQPAQPQPFAQPPRSPASVAQPGMTGAFIGSPEQTAAQIASIRDPQERANAQAAFEEQMRRTGGNFAGGAMAAGPSSAETAAAKAAETRAVEQARADVVPTQQAKAGLDSANYMYNLLDMAITHPGRETATGMSGTIDPRNYFPGTNAKNFGALLEQIKGSAFLQAFQSLKGGGAITEMEGKQATNAIARLQTAQSDAEFKSALSEFQGIIGQGIKRMGGTVSNGRESGGPVRISGDADYNALPSGSEFVGPDGQIRRKP